MNRVMKSMIWIATVGSLALGAASAGDRKPADEASGWHRSKSIDFDTDVIEGMNKNPLDALTSVSRKDDKQQGHLYHRKAHFKNEIRQSAREMGYTQ